MKKHLLSAIMPVGVLLSVALSLNSCSKSDDNKIITDPPMATTTNIIYRRADTSITTIELWSVKSDGTNDHKIPISLPTGWNFQGDVESVISPDSKTLALGLTNDNLGQSAIYTCNVDGSNVDQVLSFGDRSLIYIQDFINPTAVLYWKTTESPSYHDDLWRVNTDGTGNQMINITLPANNRFGDGKFAKVTSDGKTIIFSTWDDASTSIYKCNIDGSNLSLITTETQSGVSLAIQTLVNNTAILYRVYGQTDVAELWTVNVDGTNKHQLNVSLPSGLSFQDQGAARASSNALFIATTAAGQTRYGQEAIYTAGLDGSNIKLVTQIPTGYTIDLEGIQQ